MKATGERAMERECVSGPTTLQCFSSGVHRVLVCGGRDYDDAAKVRTQLDMLHGERAIDELVQGGARGADWLAREWAVGKGVRCVEVRAEWDKHGRAAGPIRNRAMLELGVSLVVAFPGGRGTADMVRQAEAAGVRVVRV